jgi:3-oxoacyl-[acyl-carrier protein] reductase
VALVTGSGRNIGRAIALALAGAGLNVVVNVRRHRAEGEEVAAAVRDLGMRSIVAVADVADPHAVGRLFAEARAALGPVTVLVNNAAIRTEMPIEELDFDEWRRVLGVVLDGAFLCSRAAIPDMRAAGRGRIVNIAGMSGQAGAADRAHVVASKAGLIGLTRALAVELGADGITVNAVSPGMMDTARNLETSPREPKHHSGRSVPVGRRGRPEEIGAAVRYLVSDEAAFVTGQVLSVNGGAFIA